MKLEKLLRFLSLKFKIINNCHNLTEKAFLSILAFSASVRKLANISTSSSPSFIGGITGFCRVSFLFKVFLVIAAVITALFNTAAIFPAKCLDITSEDKQFQTCSLFCFCVSVCWRDIPGVTTRALLMMASRYQSLLTTGGSSEQY